MSYQEVTGCLCAGSYPGKLAHQDFMNDLYITDYKETDMDRKYIVRRLTPT